MSEELGPLPRVPACPFAVFDEFGQGADDRVQDYAAALVAAERERPRQVVAYMATNREGEMRFTDSPDAARELEGYGWAITPLADAGPNARVQSLP